jgi:hypothetical protein
MYFYKLMAHKAGSADALHLAERLAAWHDSMVAHERELKRQAAPCPQEECPHVDAPDLWLEAQQAFGDAAEELVFLRTRALRC